MHSFRMITLLLAHAATLARTTESGAVSRPLSDVLAVMGLASPQWTVVWVDSRLNPLPPREAP
eukprot:4064335-Pleurochrysis_carterae.AAC.1